MQKRLTFEIAALNDSPRRIVGLRYYVEMRQFSWLFDAVTADPQSYHLAKMARRSIDEYINDPFYPNGKAAP